VGLALSGQMIANCQSCLASTNDRHVDVLEHFCVSLNSPYTEA
jgi:hypothetical protein